MSDTQAQTISLLADPALHDGAAPRHVETHISHLFIGPSRVFKLKKPLKTNFLDFSTVETRRAMCEREIAVNQVARDLYRGVRSVTAAADGTLAIDGDGTVIDWIVEMRPFDGESEFDRLAARDALTRKQIEELADTVASLHADAPRAPRRGEAAHQIERIEQIAGAMAAADVDDALVTERTAWTEAALVERTRHARLIEARGRHGFVRRGHGDLHLGNVCLYHGRPLPFDAMEFNEDIATTDILYDAGFVTMDLLAHGLRQQATDYTGRYLGATRDYGGLALLPLFVSMRAAVRAIPAATEAPGEARRLLGFARSVLLPRAKPRLVTIGGASGTGKSTLARALGATLGAPLVGVVLRSDVVRKRLLGVAPETALPPDAYADGTGDQVYRRLLADARRVLASGFDCIVDATFLEHERQDTASALAGWIGASFTGLWLHAEPDTLKARVAARQADASDATPVVVDAQLDKHPDAPGWVRLDAGQTPEAVLAAARDALYPDGA